MNELPNREAARAVFAGIEPPEPEYTATDVGAVAIPPSSPGIEALRRVTHHAHAGRNRAERRAAWRKHRRAA